MRSLLISILFLSFQTVMAQGNLDADKKQIAEMEKALAKKKASLKEKLNAVDQEKFKHLRKRETYFDVGSIITLVLSDRYESGNTTRDRSRQILNINGGWNWGNYELGPILSYDHYDKDNNVEDYLGVGGQFDYNFTENKPGNDLVSFFRLYVQSYTYEDNSSDEDGLITTVGGGVKYFPFGEYLSLIGQVYYRHVDGDFGTSTFTTKGFRTNGSLVVYF